MCRKKKIKCDGKMPACTHCINYKTECVFTQVEKKRNPPKGCVTDASMAYELADHSRSAKYIEGLENRLGRMESPSQSTSEGGSTSTPQSKLASPEPQQSKNGEKNGEKKSDEQQKVGEGVEELSDMMCSLVTNNCGETRYIGTAFANVQMLRTNLFS